MGINKQIKWDGTDGILTGENEVTPVHVQFHM